MNAVSNRVRNSHPSLASRWRNVAMLPLLALPAVLCFDAVAQAQAASSFAQGPLVSGEPRGVQAQMVATSLPRFENIDGAGRTSRLDLSLMPAGRTALGLAIGVTSQDGTGFNQSGLASSSPSVDLGLHLRYEMEGNSRVDVRAWRRLPQADALSLAQSREPSYGARVEMRVPASAGNGFVADRGFVGMQLESGARITLRKSGGKPMMYYRNQF